MTPPETQQTDAERIDALEAKLIDLQLANLRTASEDHERRLRLIEATNTELLTLKNLIVGGGALSALNLMVLVAHFVIGK